jgi:2-keto-4-pentenoate hydratase/2-oxohepta-3-ene-1,7-dioic acid hydratase in catechol pathway
MNPKDDHENSLHWQAYSHRTPPRMRLLRAVMLLAIGLLIAATQPARATSSGVSTTPDTPFKLATFGAAGNSRIGIALGDRLLDLTESNAYVEKNAHLAKMKLPTEMRALIEQYADLHVRLYQIANYLKDKPLASLPFSYDPTTAKIEAPIKYPWNLLNMAFNFWGHAHEMAPNRTIDIDPDRDDPFIFAKSPRDCIIDPGATFYIPPGREKLDWEGELTVVMGPKPATRTSIDNALDYVFGYTIINDLSDRGGGMRKAANINTDWFSQKSRDGEAPIGPYITPKEFIPDPQLIHMTTRVNGVVKQDGETSDMIYDVRHQIAYITSIMTLYPGDMIATGSQAGTGVAHKPPEFLHPGDVVEVTIQGIGTLSTPVAASMAAPGPWQGARHKDAPVQAVGPNQGTQVPPASKPQQ